VLRSRRSAPPPLPLPLPLPATLAFAGAGTISVIHGLAAAAAGLPVVAVASRSAERSQERAAQMQAEACSYRELPAGADAVVIATPPAAHVAQALAAVEAGVAVLVEKPLATTLADADALVAAEEAGGRIVYAENLAFAPVVRAALSFTASMGRISYLEVRALSPRPTWGDFLEPHWGGGALFDLGAHPVALALLLSGDDEPVEVTASLSSSDGLVVDDHAEVLLRFASGLVARVEASWRHHDVVWDLQASSETMVVRAELLPIIGLECNGERVPVPPPPSGVEPLVFDLGYVEQIQALAAAVGGQRSPLDAAFGRRVLDVLCAAYASAGSGGPVPLPFDGPRDRTPLELWRG
jgi:predicted dehydrogenase